MGRGIYWLTFLVRQETLSDRDRKAESSPNIDFIHWSPALVPFAAKLVSYGCGLTRAVV